MFYKAFNPGYVGHKEAGFVDCVAFVEKYGFEGYWFDAPKDFVGDPAAVKALLEKHHLKAGGFGLPVEFRGSEEKFQEDMKKLPEYLSFAQAIGSKTCMTWIIPSSDTLTYDQNFELYRSRLVPICAELKKYDVTLGIEFVGPHTSYISGKYGFIHNLEGVQDLIHAIGADHVGLMMDAWHWDMAGQCFADFAKIEHPEWIAGVHINDAPAGIPADEQQDLVRRLPGTTGIVHIDEFFCGLESVGYEGPVMVEPFEAFLGEISLESAIRMTAQSMNRVWPMV